MATFLCIWSPDLTVHSLRIVGVCTGAQQSVFYAQVREDQKVQAGGGMEHDGERIELLALPLESVEAFVVDESISKTTGAMFGLLWVKSQLLSGGK